MKKLFASVAVLAFVGLFVACANAEKKASATTAVENVAPLQASATLVPTEGNVVHGTVRFIQEAEGIRIVAEVSGFSRAGLHGFHVHEVGDCSAPDAMSAKGHFNPHGTLHGKAGEGVHHAGDLPSLDADGEGNAKLNALLGGLALTGEHSIVGRSLIVHAEPDDYTTQPTGNSGARVACAVIQYP